MAAVQNKPKVEAKGRGGNYKLRFWKQAKGFFKTPFGKNRKESRDNKSQDYDLPDVSELNADCESILSNGINVVDSDQSEYSDYDIELEDEKWNEKRKNTELIAQIVAYIQRKDKLVVDTIQTIKSVIMVLKEYYENAAQEKINLDIGEENEKRQNLQFQEKNKKDPHQSFENSQFSRQSLYFQSIGNRILQPYPYEQYPPPMIKCPQQITYKPNHLKSFNNPPPEQNTCSVITTGQQTKFRCKRCRKSGHNIINCLARYPAETIKCYNCKLFGHIAKNCSTPPAYFCDNYKLRNNHLNSNKKEKELCYKLRDKTYFRLDTNKEIGENGIGNALRKQITLIPRSTNILRIVDTEEENKEESKEKELKKDGPEPNKVGLRENGRKMTQSATKRISMMFENESKNKFKGTEMVVNERAENIKQFKDVEIGQVEETTRNLLKLSENSETKIEPENKNENNGEIEIKIDKSRIIKMSNERAELFATLKTGIGDAMVVLTEKKQI